MVITGSLPWCQCIIHLFHLAAQPPTWNVPACRSIDKEVNISWTGPDDRSCCTTYQVDLSDGVNMISNQTNNTFLVFDNSVLVSNVSYDARVTCLSATGFRGIPSEPRPVSLSKFQLNFSCVFQVHITCIIIYIASIHRLMMKGGYRIASKNLALKH